MTPKFVLASKYPFVFPYDRTLSMQIEKLRKENEDLRARLVQSQEAKSSALKQASQLRKEKARLRLKVAALKQELSLSETKSLHLAARITELQALLETLE